MLWQRYIAGHRSKDADYAPADGVLDTTVIKHSLTRRYTGDDSNNMCGGSGSGSSSGNGSGSGIGCGSSLQRVVNQVIILPR